METRKTDLTLKSMMLKMDKRCMQIPHKPKIPERYDSFENPYFGNVTEILPQQ